LTVEDGTGLAGANSYVSLPDADAYFAARLNSTWITKTDDERSSALIQATQYLDTRYSFRGCQVIDTQALAWPRYNRGLPAYNWPVKRVKDACCEAALRAATGALFADQDASIVTSEKVGDIAVTYAEAQRNGGQVRIAIVDELLGPFLASGGMNIELVRA
jgi:hypothetical protein